ncbi:NUDIX hydrolase [Cohnella sp. GCM10012308]|uniref:NUDIX hydrolase n=1 Tax=Cohnella sp. GCM10012308 TaxID=3317329 RepID=UPI00362022A0
MNEVSRFASRGILFNENGQVAMMEMTALNLYKLPGGGLEENEDKEAAFLREIREETGYDAVVVHALGYIDEHKFKNQFMQRSYCFIAKAASQQRGVELSEEEVQLGMQVRWMSCEEAIAKMRFPIENCEDYSTRFMVLRDRTILELASRWLDSSVA